MIINLTKHPVTVILDQKRYTFLPWRIEARCKEIVEQVGDIDGFPVVIKSYGEVENLPDEDEEGEIYYIVSAMVRMALPHRRDLLSPGDLVRDNNGNVIGCKNFGVNPPTVRVIKEA